MELLGRRVPEVGTGTGKLIIINNKYQKGVRHASGSFSNLHNKLGLPHSGTGQIKVLFYYMSLLNGTFRCVRQLTELREHLRKFGIHILIGELAGSYRLMSAAAIL